MKEEPNDDIFDVASWNCNLLSTRCLLDSFLFLSLFICLNGISCGAVEAWRDACYIWGHFLFFFFQGGSDPLVLSVALPLLRLMRTPRERLLCVFSCCREVWCDANAAFKDAAPLAVNDSLEAEQVTGAFNRHPAGVEQQMGVKVTEAFGRYINMTLFSGSVTVSPHTLFTSRSHICILQDRRGQVGADCCHLN